jgi:hypothetical protein
MLSWKKLGHVFNPTVSTPRPWMQAYAQCPFPVVLNDKTLRVYFSSRGQRDDDMQYVAYPAYVDLARDNLSRVVKVADAPLMPLGNPGTFDEFGIQPGSFVQRGSDIYTYYTGWTRMQKVPYTLATGVAVSRDGGDCFERLGEGPILGPTLNEPFFVSGSVVRVIDDQWHMWYITGKKWLQHEGKYEPVYHIVHATSDNGIAWKRDGVPVIPRLSEDECQVSLAAFFRGGKWHGLFSYRQPTGFRTDTKRAYRLGYVSSRDLKTWERDDSKAGIDVSESGWDSQMICYPQVGEVDGRILLFYCGNDFGREGFGIAELTGYPAA